MAKLPEPIRRLHDRLARRQLQREIDPIEEGVVGSRETGRGLTDDERFRTGRLAGLGMTAAIWTLSWPVLVESFLNSAVGLTDTVFAAQLGVAEADAIAAATYLMWLIGLVIMAVGVGATALISRAIGAGRMATANAILSQALLLGVAAAIPLGAVVIFGAGAIASLLSLTDDAARAFRSYMVVIGLSTPIAAVLFVLIACARGAGDSARPLQAMIVRNIVNVALSWALSGIDLTTAQQVDGAMVEHVWLANPFPFDLGILGIALGTAIGDLAGALVVLRMAARGAWGIRIKRRRLLPHAVTLCRLVRLGAPNFAETFGMWFGNFLIMIIVGWIARDAVVDGLMGSHMIGVRIEAISFLPGFAMGMAAATLCGQYLGAGRADMARKAVWRCAWIAGTVMATFGLVFMLYPTPLIAALSSQAVHLDTVPMLLMICGAVQIPFALGIVLRSAMRGAGDVRWAMAITWATTYGVRLPGVILLSGIDLDVALWEGARLTLHNPMPDGLTLAGIPVEGLTGVWFGLCLEIAVRGALFAARFIQGGWAKLRV